MPGGVIDVDPEAHHHHGKPAGQINDEDRLADLGYKQELKRGWSVIQSFGISFSIISVITGVTTLFLYGLTTGGPGVMASGWIIVSFFTMFVALAMAEIVSSIPTSGGPYHWAALIAKPKYSAFAAWTTGYANLLGQVAVTTGISFGNAGLISTLGALHGFDVTPAKTVGIYAGLLVSHGLVNTFGVTTLGVLNHTSIALHSLGVFGLVVALLAKAPTHRSGAEVFSFFYDATGWGDRASHAYVAVISILTCQYTITGFDASAHLAEETTAAAWNAPIGVITSVGASAVFGFFVLLGFLFSIQDFDATVNSEVGQPVLQIFCDVFGIKGATVAFAFIIICVWHCGLFSITSNSRMMYAFSRDRALPGWFDYVDSKYSSPIRTIWLAVVLAFILSLPSLGSAVAFAAATSIATIGLYISYGIPILILLIEGDNFVRGPFHLGKFSRPVGFVAVSWICFITIAGCLPELTPVDSQTLNYTPVAVGIVAFYALSSWFLWARKWFKGPRAMALEELAVEAGEPNTHLHKSGSVEEKKGGDISEAVEPAN
ncbi:APA family basic amino acid/polyamine antiporter [Meredithblackwellia eburnea MCA 4105]